MSRGQDPDRRRVFRRMEWLYVWGPPAAAVLTAAGASAILAAFVPLEGITFWGRWGLGMLILLVAPVVVYIARELLNRR